jgi:hypothetical protein
MAAGRRRRVIQLGLIVAVAITSNLAAISLNAATSGDGRWPGILNSLKDRPFVWAAVLTAAAILGSALVWWRDQDTLSVEEADDTQVLTRILDKVRDLLVLVNSSLTGRRTYLLKRTRGAMSPHMAAATDAIGNAVEQLQEGMHALDRAAVGVDAAVPSSAIMRRIRKQERDWTTQLTLSARRAATRANTADQAVDSSRSTNLGDIGWYVSRNVIALEGTVWLLNDAEQLLRDLLRELRTDRPSEAGHASQAFVRALSEAVDKLNGCRTSTSIVEDEVRTWMTAIGVPMSQYAE